MAQQPEPADPAGHAGPERDGRGNRAGQICTIRPGPAHVAWFPAAIAAQSQASPARRSAARVSSSQSAPCRPAHLRITVLPARLRGARWLDHAADYRQPGPGRRLWPPGGRPSVTGPWPDRRNLAPGGTRPTGMNPTPRARGSPAPLRPTALTEAGLLSRAPL